MSCCQVNTTNTQNDVGNDIDNLITDFSNTQIEMNICFICEKTDILKINCNDCRPDKKICNHCYDKLMTLDKKDIEYQDYNEEEKELYNKLYSSTKIRLTKTPQPNSKLEFVDWWMDENDFRVLIQTQECLCICQIKHCEECYETVVTEDEYKVCIECDIYLCNECIKEEENIININQTKCVCYNCAGDELSDFDF